MTEEQIENGVDGEAFIPKIIEEEESWVRGCYIDTQVKSPQLTKDLHAQKRARVE